MCSFEIYLLICSFNESSHSFNIVFNRNVDMFLMYGSFLIPGKDKMLLLAILSCGTTLHGKFAIKFIIYLPSERA